MDEQYFEKRKLEIANDGLLGFADETLSFRETVLDKQPLLSVSEINEISGMQAWEITKEEFEYYWDQSMLLLKSSNPS